MSKLLQRRIRRLLASASSDILRGGKKGLEKESLRVTGDGSIAASPHPPAWGAPLTHPYITTDYSEALPETITPAFDALPATVDFLDDIHRFLHQHLPAGEMLWAASMPCAVAEDSAIPIAEYGSSNIGRMKHVYRVGLDYRYGRRMQAIAGVHFNYSLPVDFWPVYQDKEELAGPLQAFIDDGYFGLIRNIKRLGWLIPFLFGNSPAVCKSFLAGRTTRFKQLTRGTYYLPYATSLRMSDIGYKNKNQAALIVSYDDLGAYVRSLRKAIATPYPEYEAIGVKDGDRFIQLSTNVLQIENEYYSFIRPKRSSGSEERPTTALAKNGVDYVEVRALDVNCLSPVGVDIEQLYFLEAFLIYCLLETSPLLSEAELRAIEYNELTVALRGRAPGLELVRDGGRECIRSWCLEICRHMQPICEHLDAGRPQRDYQAALTKQLEAIEDPDRLPSAVVLSRLLQADMPFQEYMLELSAEYRDYFVGRPPSAEVARRFDDLAARSIASQAELEDNDDTGFEEYVHRYLSA